MSSKQLKAVSMFGGTAAVLAMGVLSVTLSDVSTAQTPTPAPPGPVTTSEVTSGRDDHRIRGARGAGDLGGHTADHHNAVGEPADG